MGWRMRILMLLVLPLTLFGCGGGDDSGATSSGGGSQFAAATATDLAQRSFPFPNGLSQTLATRYGLPAGQTFSLQFGTFTSTTAPLTLPWPPAMACRLARRFRCNLGRSPAQLRLSR